MSAFMPMGFDGQRADAAQAGAELVLVHERERDGLHHAEAAGLGHGGDELGIAARVHGAADERHLDAGVAGERRCRSWTQA